VQSLCTGAFCFHFLMKIIDVPVISEGEISFTSKGMPQWPGIESNRQMIDTINWPSYSYAPEVSFSAALTESSLLLSFLTDEDNFKAEKTITNDEVYEDSCVEAFIAPANDGIYYNFEFNAIGTCLMGYGTSRHDRKRTVPEIIERIRRFTTAGSLPIPEIHERFTWEMSAIIPLDVFFLHRIILSSETCFRANFYKCGNKLTKAHYLSWNPILTREPDFHRPEFFGLMQLRLPGIV